MDPAGFTVQLPYDETAAGTARRLVSKLLAGFRAPDEVVGDATLVVHELVINGLIHGSPDDADQIMVSGQIRGDQLRISVLDQGHAGTVAAQPFTQERTSGRGLSMVESLSSAWAVDRSAGTRVSAWLPMKRA